jgi:uncharacterized membrane protein YjjP (DUF1212 family)
MKHLWSMKYAVVALVLLGGGWFFFNIWFVMGGAVLSIFATSELQKAANISLRVRAMVCASIVALLVAIHFLAGNKEVLLAAGIIMLLAFLHRWVRHSSDKKES